MKTIAILFTAAAMIFGGATQADAREHGGGGYRTTVVVTGHDRRGRPIYSERYFIRMNSHGRPMWGYRPVRHSGGGEFVPGGRSRHDDGRRHRR